MGQNTCHRFTEGLATSGTKLGAPTLEGSCAERGFENRDVGRGTRTWAHTQVRVSRDVSSSFKKHYPPSLPLYHPTLSNILGLFQRRAFLFVVLLACPVISVKPDDLSISPILRSSPVH